MPKLPFVLAAVLLATGPALAQDAPTPPNTPQDAPQDTPPGNNGSAPDEQSMGQSNEPTAEDIENAKQAFMEGHQLFQAQDYAAAIVKFKEAYRLSKNPLLLYNIGFTLDMNKEGDLALFYYEKFLTDVGPKSKVYDEVKGRVKAIKEAKEAEAVFDSGSMGTIAEPQKASITEFQHKEVEDTPPGVPLDITAFIPEGSGWQVTLFYRAAGEIRYGSTLMRPRYNEIVGRIPASKTGGASLQYYIEVRDKTGNLVDRRGRAASPILVFVDPKAKPRFYPDLDQDASWQSPEDTQAPTPTVLEEKVPEEGAVRDDRLTPLQYAKWGATGAAVSMIGLWLVFDQSAANMALSLENEAERSLQTDDCPSGPPCRSFSQFQKELQKRGERYELMANVSLVLGISSAIAAGYLWQVEFNKKAASKAAGEAAVSAVPVVGRDFVGGAALLTF